MTAPVTAAAQAARRQSWTGALRRWLLGWRWRRARRFCQRHGHTMGPVGVTARYLVQHRPQFDVGMHCPRCGGTVKIVGAVPYTFKGHQALHNAAQAMFRPAGKARADAAA